MGEVYNRYIESISDSKIRILLRAKYSHIGDYEESNKKLEDVESIFKKTEFHSPHDIRLFRSHFRKFAATIHDYSLLQLLDNINLSEIWANAKNQGAKKFVSFSAFQDSYIKIGNISILEHPTHVQALYLCLYEGIFSKDFSVLANLTASDINGNNITCRSDDGNQYTVNVSDKLVDLLRTLSHTYTWAIEKRGSLRNQPINGKAPDSCFKIKTNNVEKRSGSLNDNYRNRFGKWIRKIISRELGYHIEANDIYISGIMYRISTNLHSNGFSVIDGFSPNNRDIRIKSIIQQELDQSHYTASISNFKSLVRGHLDVFTHINNLSRPDSKRLIDEAFEDILAYKSLEYDASFSHPDTHLRSHTSKKKLIEIGERKVYPRDRQVALCALVQADFKCELDEDHPSFIRRSNNQPYMEPHHLIPLAYSDLFDVDLDVPENIVSLCSNCHNQLHYGKNIDELLNWLYDLRKQKLEEAGLIITLEELIWMYHPDKQI